MLVRVFSIFPIFFWIVFSKYQGDDVFEGTIQYSYRVTSATNTRLPFPISSEEVSIDENNILFSPSEGLAFGRDIYLDKIKMRSYEIDHLNHTITRIDQQKVEIINPIEFKRIGSASLLDYQCEIYFLKYVHSFEYAGGFGDIKTDTLTCTYYIAPEVKILSAKFFSVLQGNNNSLLLDGRFESIPLKVVVLRSNGIKIVIEATRVSRKEITNSFLLPASYSMKNP